MARSEDARLIVAARAATRRHRLAPCPVRLVDRPSAPRRRRRPAGASVRPGGAHLPGAIAIADLVESAALGRPRSDR